MASFELPFRPSTRRAHSSRYTDPLYMPEQPTLLHRIDAGVTQPKAPSRLLQHRSDRKEKRQRAKTLARHIRNAHSSSPQLERKNTILNPSSASDTPKRATSVPIDDIRKALTMTKICDETPPTASKAKASKSRGSRRNSHPEGSHPRNRANSDPDRYGATEVFTRTKYYVP